jgi:Tfp pilus assembly protein PilF
LVILVSALSLLTIARNFEWRSAVTLFENTLKASLNYPTYKNVRVRYNLAIAYYRNGKYEEAESQYRQILEIDPAFEEAHYNLAVLYIEQGFYDKAEQECLKAIEISKNYIPPYYALGVIYKKRGDLKKTKEFWRKMLEIETDCKQCNLFRAKIKSFLTP